MEVMKEKDEGWGKGYQYNYWGALMFSDLQWHVMISLDMKAYTFKIKKQNKTLSQVKVQTRCFTFKDSLFKVSNIDLFLVALAS